MSHTIPTYIKEEAGQMPGHRLVSAWCNGAVVYSRSCTLLELDYHLTHAVKACETVIRKAQTRADPSQALATPEPTGLHH